MQALTFHSPYNIIYTSTSRPTLCSPTDAIVRIRFAGLCGSDLHIYRGTEPGPDRGTVMGHEFVGVVAEVGSKVVGIQVGDRVGGAFTTCCGKCYYCTHSLSSRCINGLLLGYVSSTVGLHGTQCEYVLIPNASSSLFTCPPSVSDIETLLLGDVLTTGYHCALNGIENVHGLRKAPMDEEAAPAKQNRKADLVVLILGCGPVGLMAVVSALYLGIGKVIAADAVEERVQMARTYGAEGVRPDAVREAVSNCTDGRGADVILEAVGSNSALTLALELVRPGGVISSVGVNNSDTFPFSPTSAYNKNVTFKTGRCPVMSLLPQVMPLVLSKKYDLEKIVTHRMKLSDGNKAYEIFDKKTDACIKVVFEVGVEE
ncbi:7973_t:CDS:2 [Paraglomus occultum]|uniref:7973_t:CDS:1 n=1 Tax=Paraglomus occultum TaxID=144539 RepID=A0A9N8W367_9GLOM|nr:7973_t:CDS:2 [Paraglomus occultum]